MINTYTFLTKVASKEFQHTIYAVDIESAIQNWLDEIDEVKFQIYSFSPELTEEIKSSILTKYILRKIDTEYTALIYTINNQSQITYITKLEKGEPDIIAELSFFTTQQGGRSGYAKSGYRPLFQIQGIKEWTSSELIFVGKGIVFPGETVVCEMRLLSPDFFKMQLYPNMPFHLSEGPKLVASGKILNILRPELSKTSL